MRINPSGGVGLVFCLPDILTGRAASGSADGSALLLVFVPAGRLAGAVAVVGEFALNTAVEVGPLAEAVMAHRGGQTGGDTTAEETDWELYGQVWTGVT